jgi:hypothetical protein
VSTPTPPPVTEVEPGPDYGEPIIAEGDGTETKWPDGRPDDSPTEPTPVIPAA